MIHKITAILVDDESDSREVLAGLLGKYFPEVKIVGQASNVEDAYTLVTRLDPQLVFLDIQMPMGNGFTLLKKFETIPFEVVFVTSFDRYAIDAIKFSALDYLLKPVEVSELRHAVDKAVKNIVQKMNRAVQVVNLLHSLGTEVYDRKLTVHVGENVNILPVSEVECIEGDGRYSRLSMVGGETYVTSRNLKEFEEYLGENSPFIRISKSYLINTRHIKSYSKGEFCLLEMESGKTFEVARRKKQEVLEKLRRG